MVSLVPGQATNPYPERWFPFPADPGQTYDGEKPLYPFCKRSDGPGEGDYWTSDDVQQTSVLGYVCDDFSRMGKLNHTVPEYMGKRYDWATRKPDSSILADMPTPLLSSAVEDEVEGGEGVESMRPEHVGPFLEERLRWRVVFHGFDRRDPRAEGLQLRIGVSAKVHHDGGESTYEEYAEVVDRILAAASPVASAVVGA